MGTVRVFQCWLPLGAVCSGKPLRGKNVTIMFSQTECAWILPTNTDSCKSFAMSERAVLGEGKL